MVCALRHTPQLGVRAAQSLPPFTTSCTASHVVGEMRTAHFQPLGVEG